MRFVRQAADWVRSVGRFWPYVDACFGGLTQIDQTNAIVNTIKSANDPPRSLEGLQDRVNLEDRSGYHRHQAEEDTGSKYSETLEYSNDQA
jgi:hypothetical protein